MVEVACLERGHGKQAAAERLLGIVQADERIELDSRRTAAGAGLPARSTAAGRRRTAARSTGAEARPTAAAAATAPAKTAARSAATEAAAGRSEPRVRLKCLIGVVRE